MLPTGFQYGAPVGSLLGKWLIRFLVGSQDGVDVGVALGSLLFRRLVGDPLPRVGAAKGEELGSAVTLSLRDGCDVGLSDNETSVLTPRDIEYF